MGILSCPLPCSQKTRESSPSHSPSNSSSHLTLHSESSSSSSHSLSSQPSLPSVPSLSSPFPPLKQGSTQTTTTHHQCIATLKGHSSYISSLSLAGKFLYSGSSNGEIRAWSRDPQTSTTGKLVAATHGAGVKSILILGEKLFSAHQDNKIRVWKIDNNSNSSSKRYECIATLPTMNDRLTKCFSANNYIEVRRHKKCTWVHHVDTVSALATSSDGSLLYSASWDRTFKIWKTSSFRCLESVKDAHDDAINAIVVSKDGYVYTGSADKKIKVWKKNDTVDYKNKHSVVATLEKHRSSVNALALSEDGSFLYSGACDRSILVWERESNCEGHMALRGALRGHTKAILCLAVVSDLVCSGSADNTVRIWRRGGGAYSYSCLAVLDGHRKPVKCLTAVADRGDDDEGNSDSWSSFLLYGGSLDCDIKIWRIRVPVP